MKASHHVAVSALASTCLQITVRSWELTIATFMSGIFIDLDHYIDYLMEYSSPCDMKKFFHCIYEEKLRKIRMLFHSWELLVVLSIMGWISTWNPGSWVLPSDAGSIWFSMQFLILTGRYQDIHYSGGGRTTL